MESAMQLLGKRTTRRLTVYLLGGARRPQSVPSPYVDGKDTAGGHADHHGATWELVGIKDATRGKSMHVMRMLTGGTWAAMMPSGV